jgi:hypothetical protein
MADSVDMCQSLPVSSQHLPCCCRGEIGLAETAGVGVSPGAGVGLRPGAALGPLGGSELIHRVRVLDPLAADGEVPPVARGEEHRRGVTRRDTQKAVDLDVVDRLLALLFGGVVVVADVVDVDPEMVELPDELVGVGLR